MEAYELLYIIPFYVDPKESIEYYTKKIEEKGGRVIKTEVYSGENLSIQEKEKLEGIHICIKYYLFEKYYHDIIDYLDNDHDVIRQIVIKVSEDKNIKTNKQDDSSPKCPFCGGEFHLLLCDEEGNPHDDDYLNNPYSGISYCIVHSIKDVPNGVHCPIATSYEDEAISEYLYETKEEALTALKIRSN